MSADAAVLVAAVAVLVAGVVVLVATSLLLAAATFLAAGTEHSEAPQHTARPPCHIPTHGPENPVHMSIYDAGLVAAIEEASAQPFLEARPRQLRTEHPSRNSS